MSSPPPGQLSPALPPALREATLKRLTFVVYLAGAALIVSEFLHWLRVVLGLEPVLLLTSLARWLCLGATYSCSKVLTDKKRDPGSRLLFTRAWLWGVTLAIAFMEWHTIPAMAGIAGIGVSRVCLAVALAPILIPDSLKRNLSFSAGLLATLPIGYVLARMTGLPRLANSELFIHLTSNLIAVGPTWLAAATIHQLREQIVAQFGSYRLVSKIGGGAFGEVWEAAHRHLRRPAAIKLIKPAVRDDDVLERFWREAATLSSLECPHTVRLLDYGSSDDGTLYLAMELLRGLTFEELVQRHGPQPEERVASLLAQVCLSLEEAHGQGLIHRDIKCANLFLCRIGIEPDFVKLLDFGLVKTLGAGPSNLTGADQVVGTPDCMSPQQISGKVLDGRSDLYSLGCVGYLLLTGSQVFTGETAMQVILGHLSLDPEPPSQRLGRPISPKLEGLIMRCLEKDPQYRPANARELYEELMRLPQWSRADAQAWWDDVSSAGR